MTSRTVVIGLGGTIAMSSENGSGLAPNISIDELLKRACTSCDVTDVSTIQHAQKPSCGITITDIISVANLIRQQAKNDVERFIVVQGTDTIEESAFGLQLLLSNRYPVIVTGAMRGSGQPGADGTSNLSSSICVSSSTRSRELGVVVCMDSEIHQAAHVQKTDSIRVSAFSSALAGPIGRVVEGRLLLFSNPLVFSGICPEDIGADNPVPRVALITPTIGDDGTLIRNARENRYQGMVVSAMGGGHVPDSMADQLEFAANDMPVLFCSRASSGQVCRFTYGYPGSEMDLLDRGLISAGWLRPQKAHLLLSLALMYGLSTDRIRECLSEYDGG